MNDRRQAFRHLVAVVTGTIADRPLDASLDASLNAQFGPGSATYEALRTACLEGIRDGWMCQREAGGIRYGRVATADDSLHRFSVDVVDMNEVVGPHHAHPEGEIDLVMPIDSETTFDGRRAGWVVYPRGSAHRPTVAGGRALVLYLLPEGRIEFTRGA